MKKISIIFIVLISFVFFNRQQHVIKADTTDNISQQTDNNNDSSSDDNDDSDDDDQARPAKSITIHYQDIDGNTISSDRTITTTGKSVYADGGNDSHAMMKLIKGYINYYYYKDYSYNNLPSTLTVKYVKTSVAEKQIEKYYMKYLNYYRKKEKVKPLKYSNALNKRASVRTKELLKSFDHTRPDGSSYNDKNSGYGEVIEIPSLLFSGPNNSLNYKMTGQRAVVRLLTEDKIHNQAMLNKWANYAGVSLRLTTTDLALCGLFSLNNK